MRPAKPPAKPVDKLGDALEDAEMFLDSTIGELRETLTHLEQAKRLIRSKRMTLARKAKT